MIKKIAGINNAGSKFKTFIFFKFNILNPEHNINTPPIMDISFNKHGVKYTDKMLVDK